MPKAKVSSSPSLSSGSSAAAPPKNWPSSIKYISQSQYTPDFPQHVRIHLEQANSTSPPLSSRSKSLTYPSRVDPPPAPGLTSIRKIEEKSHPAYGQCGLFAAKAISPNTLIVEYRGELHVDDRQSSDYDLSLVKLHIRNPISLVPSTSTLGLDTTRVDPLSEDIPPQSDSENTIRTEYEYRYVNVGIDASKMGNEARFVNDYRGTGADRPNAFFKDITCGGDAKEKGKVRGGMPHMTIWSGKEGIAKGREILVSYGKGWWSARKDGDGVE